MNSPLAYLTFPGAHYNRYKALEPDEQENSDVDKGLSKLEGSPTASQPTPHITHDAQSHTTFSF